MRKFSYTRKGEGGLLGPKMKLPPADPMQMMTNNNMMLDMIKN